MEKKDEAKKVTICYTKVEANSLILCQIELFATTASIHFI